MKRNVKYKGELDLGGIQISCYVLDDGTRVLSGRKMQEALRMVDEDGGTQNSGNRLNRYLEQKSLQPYIHGSHLKPIECWYGGTKINGYHAEALIEICDAFLEARKHIELSSRQDIIAAQCEILVRSFAKVGLIALVDEATGYQHDREKDELQKILKAYISEELLPWQKRFPDVFYKELFRLNGWDYTVKGIKNRPGVIGKWTNTVIYQELPAGVLENLKKKSEENKRSARYHQFLTNDVGEPNLQRQISKVIALFQISDNMKDFWNNFNKMKARQIEQSKEQFQFDENGHTVEVTEKPKAKKQKPKSSNGTAMMGDLFG